MEEKQLTLFVVDSPVKMYPSQGDAGLAGERSGLWFEFARIIDEIEPRWVIIENRPVFIQQKDKTLPLSFNGWRSAVWCCWRVLDAQFSGSPNEGGACSLSQVLKRKHHQKDII